MPSALGWNKQSWNEIEIKTKKKVDSLPLISKQYCDLCKYEITHKRPHVETTVWKTTWN